MTTLPISVERRAGQRFAFNLPISLRDQTTVAEGFGVTQDVSSRGVFFFTDMALNPGAELEITLKMPSEITLGETMRVRCKGRILRVVKPPVKDAKGLLYISKSYSEPGSANVASVSQSRNTRSSDTPTPETRPSETKVGVAVCFNDYEYLPATEDASPDFRRISALHGDTGSDHPAPSSNRSPRGAAP
jgi:PilZ domain